MTCAMSSIPSSCRFSHISDHYAFYSFILRMFLCLVIIMFTLAITIFVHLHFIHTKGQGNQNYLLIHNSSSTFTFHSCWWLSLKTQFFSITFKLNLCDSITIKIKILPFYIIFIFQLFSTRKVDRSVFIFYQFSIF